MTVKEIAFKLEDVSTKAWQAASLVAAINEAVFGGNYNVATYEGALYTLVIMTEDLRADVYTLTDKLFEALKSADEKDV